MNSDRDLLKHILDETVFILNTCEGLDESDFLVDEIKKRAIARSFEIIGEATKNLSTEFILNHKELAWRRMAGFRDKLIHGYFSIDYSLVWDIVRNKIPELKEQISKILAE